MRPVIARLVLLACLAAALAPAAVGATESRQVFVHLFLVPATLADGTDAKGRLPDFEAWLTATYGGYTRLGQGAGGWKNESGQVETETNTAYLVSTSRDDSKDIAARLTEDFGVRVPYVLVFSAGQYVK
mgnify:CR=1 FL=1